MQVEGDANPGRGDVTEAAGEGAAASSSAQADVGEDGDDSTADGAQAAKERGDAEVQPRQSQEEASMSQWLADVTRTDLNFFHSFREWQDLDRPEGTFTKIRPLRKAIHGSVTHCRWHRPGLEDTQVAVKKMPVAKVHINVNSERNERIVHQAMAPGSDSATRAAATRFPEDPLTEIGVYCLLNKKPEEEQPYILRMFACFCGAGSVWLATEFANGGELFDKAAEGPVHDGAVRKYIWQLLQAVQYLHAHNIGHRDISLENMLLKDDVVRLMDFGQAVALRRAGGDPAGEQLLRYFGRCGKAAYRAPEMHVPFQKVIKVDVPEGGRADNIIQVFYDGYLCHVLLPSDAVAGKACRAEVAGYTVPEVDIFACAVCLFQLRWSAPPWTDTLLSDKGFMFVASKGFASLVKAWKLPFMEPAAMELLQRMGNLSAADRPSLQYCLQSPWFRGLEADGPPAPPAAPAGE
mmetsp:Transcript_22669/g.52925  ORF Transcript_22669/g.52925 Transcript_22669/m.52925 type:complete len:464 (-) Transcript_22669:139-1530(-)